MRAMKLLTVLGDLDDRYIDDTPIERAVPPRTVLSKTLGVAVAACVALTIVVLSLLHFGHSDNGIVLTPPTEPTSDVALQTTANQSTTLSTETSTTAATKYVLVNPMGCYSQGPEVGEVFLDMYALQYLKEELESSPDAKAWVRISLNDAEGNPVLASQEKYEDIHRLASLGYEMYIYESYTTDYWGAPRHITHVFGMLTCEQLENFAVGNFGYWIDSGNTISIPFEDCERVE